jgi:large subunit ribosomal protein L53
MGSGLTESATEDGKEMKLDCEAMGIKSIVEEVDRHSRMLQKEQDLANA